MTDFDPDYWQRRIDSNPKWGERFLTGPQGAAHPSRLAVRRLLQEFQTEKGSTLSVLDLGCGPGITRLSFERLDISYVGVDATQGMVDLASLRCPSEGTEFVCGGALREVSSRTVNGESFDIVHIRAVLEHLPPELAWELLERAIPASSMATVVTFFIPTVEGLEDEIQMDDRASVYVSAYSRPRVQELSRRSDRKVRVIPVPCVSFEGEEIVEEVWVFEP